LLSLLLFRKLSATDLDSLEWMLFDIAQGQKEVGVCGHGGLGRGQIHYIGQIQIQIQIQILPVLFRLSG
jgi:hypothetical protein